MSAPFLLSPVFNGQQFFNENGLPLALGKINQYAAGSDSIQQTTYTTSSGSTPNDNPIILDGSGRYSTAIWLSVGYTYNLVVTDANDILQLSVDNVST